MTDAIQTDREVQGLKPAPLRYERTVGRARGLSVVVYPSGAKTFVIRYRADNGTRRRMQLGDYPGLSLADARDRAAALRGEIVGGRDPAAERAAARAQARFGETVADLAEGYWRAAALGLHGGNRRPLRPETLARQKLQWKTHIRPVFGDRPFRQVTRADVRRFMERLVTEGRLKPASVAVVGHVLRAFFNYAFHNDMVETNPTLGLSRPIAPVARSRLFDDEALARIMARLADASLPIARRVAYSRTHPSTALALRFLILTMSRRSEVAAAAWSEIDLPRKLWILPASRSKNGRAHVIPLSQEALEVLDEARGLQAAHPCDSIFPSPVIPGDHMEADVLTRAVNRLCASLRLPLGSPHDFRRTAATVLTGETYGVRRFIVSKALGHTGQEGPAVTGIYDRNDYLVEKRAAFDAWGRHIAGLTAVAPPPSEAQPAARSVSSRRGSAW